MKQPLFTQKNGIKKIIICFFAIAFLVICISAAVMRSDIASARNTLSMSDAIKTSAYKEMTSISQFLQSDDLNSVLNTLMASIDSQFREASLEITGDQRTQIRDTLEELIASLNDHGMIEYDSDGDLTELSKSYLSNAASYAATSVVGESEVALSNTVLSDLVSTESIDTTVSKIEESYAAVASQLSDDEGNPLDLSDMKAQLDNLKNGLTDKNGNEISISKIALRVAALETMVTTLKNSSAATADYSGLADEMNTKLAEIESELGSVKLSIQSSDTSANETIDDINQLSMDVSALALKLKDFNQSDIDTVLTDLSKEISNREKAISSLQTEIDTIAKSNSNVASLQNSVSGLSKDLTSLQTSVSTIKSEHDTWKTGVNNNIASLQYEIKTLSNTDSSTAATLSSLTQSLNAVKAAMNSNGQDLTSNITSLEQSLAAVQSQLNSNTSDLASSLAAIQDSLAQVNALIYDSRKTYTPGSYVTGSDGSTYKYIGPSDAAASDIPDPSNISYDSNGQSTYWEKVDSSNALSDQIATINTQTEKLQDVLAANSYSESTSYTKGSYVYDEVTGKFYECIADAPAGTDLSNTNYWQEAADASGLSKALSNLVSSNSLMQLCLDQEILARTASDSALQQQIRSENITDLEQLVDGIEGVTIFDKMGALLKKIITLGALFDSRISDEVANRESATQALQNDINSKISVVSGSVITLQSALEQGDADAIATAKSDLGSALDSLNAALSGGTGSAGSDVDAKIVTVKQTAENLKACLNGTDEQLAQDLANAQSTLGSQISSLNGSLTRAIDAEKAARAASDAAIQEQIHSTENTELEQKADEIEGATLFGKIGSLYNDLTSVKQSDEWVQNVTLSCTEENGERKYALSDSTDSAHSGWKMWTLDAESLGITIHAENGDIPESEVKITYAGNPVIILEYDEPVQEGVIHIYTPSVPSENLIIRTIHVQNKVMEP